MKSNIIHRILISIIVTTTMWFIVDKLIIEIPFWKYYLLEFIFIISMKILIFIVTYFQLNDIDNGEKDTY